MNNNTTAHIESQGKKFLDWKNYLIDENFDADVLTFQQTNIENDQNSIYIDKDIPRTRPDDPFLQDPDNQKLFRRMALTYCASHNLSYTSGFLELMAPFFILHSSGLPLEHCYAYFACFIRKYFPSKFLASNLMTIDERSKWIEKYSLYLESLLAYHSTKTANILKAADIDVLRFGYAWILTFFCLKTKLEVIYEILDQYFAEKDQYFFAYLFTATILIKEDVFQEKASHEDPLYLYEYLTQELQAEVFANEDSVANVLKLARKLKEETPATFESSLKQFYFQNEPAIDPSLILAIQPSEIVDFWLKKNLFKNPKNILQEEDQGINQKELEFQILDCRYVTGKSQLPSSIALPNIQFRERADVNRILEKICIDSSASHICILQSSERGNDHERLNVEYTIKELKKLERNYVSIIKGGFEGILEEMRLRNIDTASVENRKLSFFEKIMDSFYCKEVSKFLFKR